MIVLRTSLYLFQNRGKIGRSEYTNLLLFAVFPMLGGFVQILVRGFDIIWITATVSILIIFINIQKDQLHTDYLTNLYNRRYLDNYLQSISIDEGVKPIGGIMIDIDDFKRINDVYGHDSGDQALKDVAIILKRTFSTDFVARYGGDEFVVIIECENPAIIEALVRRLRGALTAHDAKRTTPYKIQLSIGYACYDKRSDVSITSFLKKLDKLMYQDKQHGRTSTA